MFYVDTEERLCLNIKYGGFVFILIQGVGWFDFNCILYKIQDVVICNEMKKLFWVVFSCFIVFFEMLIPAKV